MVNLTQWRWKNDSGIRYEGVILSTSSSNQFAQLSAHDNFYHDNLALWRKIRSPSEML